MKTRIVLLGPPASGKGTQAELITERFGIEATSTGAMLRDELQRGTTVGMEADHYTSRGELAPDSVVIELLKSWLGTRSSAFIFDGFPRTLVQAEALDRILGEIGTGLEAVLYFSLSEAVIRQRILKRVVCEKCGRVFGTGLHFEAHCQDCPMCEGGLTRRRDDTLEALEHRMIAYREKTEPLIEFYRQRGLLHEISAEDRPEAVFAKVTSILEAA